MRSALVVLLAAGCSLAPSYQRPAAPVPSRFQEGGERGGSAADLGWRKVLGEPRLQRLVAIALEHNRDLRIAALNVELVRAQYRIQRSELFPTVGARAQVEAAGQFD